MLLNCALKLVEEIILYYDAQSKKHQNVLLYLHAEVHFCPYKTYIFYVRYMCVFIGWTVVHVRLVYDRWLCSHSRLGKRILGDGTVSEMNLKVSCQFCQMCMVEVLLI